MKLLNLVLEGKGRVGEQACVQKSVYLAVGCIVPNKVFPPLKDIAL